jgi:hypothetical protein
MTLRNRFTLIGIAIIVFIFLIPQLILFAGGFKFDWETKQISKTGSLVVETKPTKADVFLDEKQQLQDTPKTFRFLFPKNYEVRVEKEGYFSWRKRLSVRSQLVTWANLDREFLTLFLSEPKLEATFDFDLISRSRNNKELIYIKKDKIYLLTVGDKEPELLGTASELTTPYEFMDHVTWENGNKVFASLKGLTVQARESIKPTFITELYSNGIHTVSFIDNRIELLDPKKKPKILTQDADTVNLEGDNVWYIKSNQLLKQDLNSRDTVLIQDDLPNFDTAKIIRSNGHIFLQLNNDLYFLNPGLELVSKGVTYASWDFGSKKLVFASNNEVKIFDPEKKESELIFRSISRVANPINNIEIGYLLLQNEDKIKAVELDGRDQRNIYDLTNSGIGFALSDDGKLLYVFSENELKVLTIR